VIEARKPSPLAPNVPNPPESDIGVCAPTGGECVGALKRILENGALTVLTANGESKIAGVKAGLSSNKEAWDVAGLSIPPRKLDRSCCTHCLSTSLFDTPNVKVGACGSNVGA
jgi:hypothetical protein